MSGDVITWTQIGEILAWTGVVLAVVIPAALFGYYFGCEHGYDDGYKRGHKRGLTEGADAARAEQSAKRRWQR